MTRLYLVRHCETEWNKQCRTQGCSNNLSLSDIGIGQAKALSDRFINIPVDIIYSSDLNRAVETAEIIGRAVSLPVHKLPALREMRFGCWEGLTTKEIMDRYNDIYEIWSSRPKETVIPDGESIIDLQERVLYTVNDIINNNEGKNILVVSHGMTLKVLILSILGVDVTFHNRIKINNCSLTIIDYLLKGPVLTQLNDTCHLV